MPRELEPSGREPIRVEVGKFKMGPPGSKFVTEDLGPCIGMALDDPGKEGGMGHFDDMSKENIMNDVGKYTTTKDKDKVKVYVRGGAPAFIGADEVKELKDQALQTMHKNRENALNALTESGIPKENMDVHWTEDMYTSVKIELNTAAGEFTTIKKPMREEEEPFQENRSFINNLSKNIPPRF